MATKEQTEGAKKPPQNKSKGAVKINLKGNKPESKTELGIGHADKASRTVFLYNMINI